MVDLDIEDVREVETDLVEPCVDHASWADNQGGPMQCGGGMLEGGVVYQTKSENGLAEATLVAHDTTLDRASFLFQHPGHAGYLDIVSLRGIY
jgi:hypothetical protein